MVSVVFVMNFVQNQDNEIMRKCLKTSFSLRVDIFPWGSYRKWREFWRKLITMKVLRFLSHSTVNFRFWLKIKTWLLVQIWFIFIRGLSPVSSQYHKSQACEDFNHSTILFSILKRRDRLHAHTQWSQNRLKHNFNKNPNHQIWCSPGLSCESCDPFSPISFGKCFRRRCERRAGTWSPT